MLKYETRVVPEPDGTFTFECACGFSSSGWASEDLTTERGRQHTAEHDGGEPMTELVDFREEHGLNGPRIDTIGFDDQAADQ